MKKKQRQRPYKIAHNKGCAGVIKKVLIVERLKYARHITTISKIAMYLGIPLSTLILIHKKILKKYHGQRRNN